MCVTILRLPIPQRIVWTYDKISSKLFNSTLHIDVVLLVLTIDRFKITPSYLLCYLMPSLPLRALRIGGVRQAATRPRKSLKCTFASCSKLFYSQYGLTQHICRKHRAPSTLPPISPRSVSPQIAPTVEEFDHFGGDDGQDLDLGLDDGFQLQDGQDPGCDGKLYGQYWYL